MAESGERRGGEAERNERNERKEVEQRSRRFGRLEWATFRSRPATLLPLPPALTHTPEVRVTATGNPRHKRPLIFLFGHSSRACYSSLLGLAVSSQTKYVSLSCFLHHHSLTHDILSTFCLRLVRLPTWLPLAPTSLSPSMIPPFLSPSHLTISL